MSVVRINQLPASSGLTPDDLILVMDDPAGNKITKSISANGLIGNATIVVTPKGSLSSPTDHTNIQNAINALPSGGRVFLQAGNYYLSNTINISGSNIEIVGAGRSTLLNCVGDYGDVFHCELPYVPQASVSGINGLVFDGIRFESTVSRTSGAAIYAAYTHQASLKNLYICDTSYGRSFGEPGVPPEDGGMGYLYYDFDNSVLTVPLPNSFYDGIKLEAQDQCLIERIVSCCTNKGISIEGSNYANADFSYNGIISRCDLYGKGGGIGINIGSGTGGTIVDYCSLNAWGTGIFADARTTTQGGGIVTIRDGFAENCEIGYKTLNFQNTIINNQWASVYCSGTGRLSVINCLQNHSIEIAGTTKAIVIGASGANCPLVGNQSNFTKLG